jgi:acyl-CoA reductase-like NAD-dependent aldehyde dehydrogenase
LITDQDRRIGVAKTYKLYIGGAFVRSESGRSYPVNDHRGVFLANAAQASRKDLRDAVAAATRAFPGWSSATAYNRGQVIYRIAEMAEGRREQLVAEVVTCEGLPPKKAQSVVDTAIDRLVWYAGWTDKVSSVLGSSNAVAGPYFTFSVPEPTGVVGVVAPAASSLLGLVSVFAPVIATGNVCVLLAGQNRPLPAVTLAETMATSDVPPGVVNVLTGRTAELTPWLATHAEVKALDLVGAPAAIRTDLERAAAGTVKRVLRNAPEGDWLREPDLRRLRAFVEIKTVWHPIGT